MLKSLFDKIAKRLQTAASVNNIYFVLFFSGNTKKAHTDQNNKETTHTSSKAAAAKCVYVTDATCFDESFFFT